MRKLIVIGFKKKELLSVFNRSAEICKELTIKHGLYYANGKERVKTHRLKEPTKSKYMGEYNTLLEMFNVSVEEVKGTYNEKPYHGLLYSALDEEGKRVGTPLKASLYGKSIGYDMA